MNNFIFTLQSAVQDRKINVLSRNHKRHGFFPALFTPCTVLLVGKNISVFYSISFLYFCRIFFLELRLSSKPNPTLVKASHGIGNLTFSDLFI